MTKDHRPRAVGHAFAAATVILASVGFSTVAYFGLLAWAVLTGSPIGGALGLLFMMLAALGCSCVWILALFLPSTIVSSFARKVFGWSRLSEIPIATATAFGLAMAMGATFGWWSGATEQGIEIAAVTYFFSLIPLGIYWWCLQGADWVAKYIAKRWFPA